MIAVWHRPGDFDCSACSKNPALKKILGCDGPAEGTRTYPPMEVNWRAEERVTVDNCPARNVTADVLAMMRSVRLADGRVSLSEQAQLPSPYLEAVELFIYHREPASVWRAKLESDHGH